MVSSTVTALIQQCSFSETSAFILPFRRWVQHNLGVGMPLPKSLRPKPLKDFVVVIGAPIIWQENDTVNTMHAKCGDSHPAFTP